VVLSDGRLELVFTNGPSPNGLLVSHDKTALFVAMTRDNAVWYVPLMPDGSLQRVGRFSSYYGIGVGQMGWHVMKRAIFWLLILRLGGSLFTEVLASCGL
jgi:hypothetical protein